MAEQFFGIAWPRGAKAKVPEVAYSEMAPIPKLPSCSKAERLHTFLLATCANRISLLHYANNKAVPVQPLDLTASRQC